MNPTPTPRVDAAVEQWKNRPWAGSPTDRPLMLARELERELTEANAACRQAGVDALMMRDGLLKQLTEAKAHHQRDEALLVQRTDEIRHLEERLKDAATRGAQVALEAYKRDLADIKAERDQLRAEAERLKAQRVRGFTYEELEVLWDKLRTDYDKARARVAELEADKERLERGFVGIGARHTSDRSSFVWIVSAAEIPEGTVLYVPRAAIDAARGKGAT